MVQHLLIGTRSGDPLHARARGWRTFSWRRRTGPALIAVLCVLWSQAALAQKHAAAQPEFWQMSLEGGRSLTWERSFSSQADVKPNQGFWNKMWDFVAGMPDYRGMIRPYSVVTDSRGRILVTDPGAGGVHVFDFEKHKYRFIQRLGKTFSMQAPQCIAVDAQDNIYVTDSLAGVIFVFGPGGKFIRAIGALKGGEGWFKRPTGIAVDSAAGRIYVTDTLRFRVYILDMRGTVLSSFGQRGTAPGEFNYPTELRLERDSLLVVDALNFRVQAFDRSGKFQYAIGQIGDSPGAMFRPKAVGMDSEGDLYVVDGQWGVVQVFNREGQLLYWFGGEGTHAGQFQLPAGLYIDRSDRVFVVDSFNRRVQVFRYAGLKAPSLESRAAAGEAQ
jgi:DNA-binding beta-propeller fold protein YncE